MFKWNLYSQCVKACLSIALILSSSPLSANPKGTVSVTYSVTGGNAFGAGYPVGMKCEGNGITAVHECVKTVIDHNTNNASNGVLAITGLTGEYSFYYGTCITLSGNPFPCQFGLNIQTSCQEGYVGSSQGLYCEKAEDNGNSCGANFKSTAGNPISIYTGEKTETALDYSGAGLFPINFTRYYHSKTRSLDEKLPGYTGGIGNNWDHSYAKKITAIISEFKDYTWETEAGTDTSLLDIVQNYYDNNPDSRITFVTVHHPDGTDYQFTNEFSPYTQCFESDEWSANEPGAEKLVMDDKCIAQSNYTFTASDQTREVYDASGMLLSYESPTGVAHNLIYDNGKLSEIQHSIGPALTISYLGDAIASVTDSDNRVWQYRYDQSGNLQFVDNPDGTTTQYHYEDVTFPNALTGVTDERGIRYSHFEYDLWGRANASYHGPQTDILTDRIQGISLKFDQYYGMRDDLTNSNGYTTNYWKQTINGNTLPTRTTGFGCLTCGTPGTVVQNYDTISFTLSSVEENSLLTKYDNYNTYGIPELVTEAAGTPEQRSTSYTYDPRFTNKVATVTEPSVYAGGNKVTTFTYDDSGNFTSIVVAGHKPVGTAVSRTRQFSYNGPYQQITEIDGPRTDVSDVYTFAYYADDALEGDNRARLKTATAPLGVVLRDDITYTPNGNIASYVTGQNVQIDFSYYPGNERLETQDATDLVSGETQLTRWTWLESGEIESVTEGYNSLDANTISFEYDDARRLTRVYDGLGNYIEYTLDTEGNILDESIYDNSGQLHKALSQTFDAYSRLDITAQVNEALNQEYAVDGTLDYETDGKSVVTDYSYDALRRLTSITQDLGGTDPTSTNALTQYAYDVQDNLISVSDPNSNATVYVYDDLGNQLSLSSPDTGLTTFTYDEAGNVVMKTDATGQLFIYSYDALNRPVLVDAPGTVDDIAYSYDSCAYGIGRRCSLTDTTGTMAYAYDWRGNLQSEVRSVGTETHTTDFSYDLNDNLVGIVYPSGRQVTYARDIAGQITNVTTSFNGSTQTLASNVVHTPFGPVTSFTHGNGINNTRAYDTAYRLDTLIAGSGLNRGHTYDAAGNLTGITTGAGTASVSLDPAAEDAGVADVGELDLAGNSPGAQAVETTTFSYQYDALNRLIQDTGPYGQRDYQYDANSNRTQRVKQDETFDEQGNPITTTRTQDYSYTPNTNQLNNIATTIDGGTTDHVLNVDTLGNTLEKNNGKKQFTYSAANRLATFSKKDRLIAEYFYNGNGQRAIKIKHKRDGTTRTIHYHYDQDGKLLGFSRYNNTGVLKAHKEFVWLDTLPIAQITTRYKNNGTVKAVTTVHIHSDHLNTPRVATDKNQTVVWRWDSDAFGQGRPDTDPDQNGKKTFIPLRFPGQIASEGGLYYNYFRDYDPTLGRYITSDPIGLAGGVNRYGYVGSNPLLFVDPLGLWFVDLGFSGATNGRYGPGVTAGVQVGPDGAYVYYGFGLGAGAGASFTLNTGSPVTGVSVSATARGGRSVAGVPIGAYANGAFNESCGFGASVGGGLGVGTGVSITATQTVQVTDSIESVVNIISNIFNN